MEGVVWAGEIIVFHSVIVVVASWKGNKLIED
jgi:hypothetical protein